MTPPSPEQQQQVEAVDHRVEAERWVDAAAREASNEERDDLLRAVEAHMAEMDMRALKSGRHRDDIDNDLYSVAFRIREASGPALDAPAIDHALNQGERDR